jgi:hypothetical protein
MPILERLKEAKKNKGEGGRQCGTILAICTYIGYAPVKEALFFFSLFFLSLPSVNQTIYSLEKICQLKTKKN